MEGREVRREGGGREEGREGEKESRKWKGRGEGGMERRGERN